MLNLINTNASVVAVTTAATLIGSLLDAAAGADQQIPSGLKGIALNPEDGDIRVLWDGNTPTASKGFLLKRGLWYNLPYAVIEQLKLISTGSTSVQVGVMLGDQGPYPPIVGVPGEAGMHLLDAIFGESATDDLLKVTESFDYYPPITASTLVKTGVGKFGGLFVSAASNTPTITAYNNTAASGEKIVDTFTPTAGQLYRFPTVNFSAGLYIAIGGTVTVTPFIK
jgi:hypothetical protein